jgi:hypothetical protein
VTSDGGTALASARTVINELGHASQDNKEPCELGDDGFSIILGPDGSFLTVMPPTFRLSTSPAFAKFRLLRHCWPTWKHLWLKSILPLLRINSGHLENRLRPRITLVHVVPTLNGLVGLTNAQTGKKKGITAEEATAILTVVDSL